MLNKQDHPKIEPAKWINVEGMDCVVTQVYGGYSLSGACEVVTNPAAPVNRDVFWDGQQWVFSDQPSFVNAAQTSRLRDFVAILREGPSKNDNGAQHTS